MTSNDNAEILADVCKKLENETTEAAQRTISEQYPLEEAPEEPKRSFSKTEKLEIFIRDGFTDRYTGRKLVFPATLRLLSEIFPDRLPYHSNWKRSESHRMYWQLSPTIDHVEALADGGADNESNWVTTSMLANQAKGVWNLEDVGFELQDPGSFDEWDGLIHFFMSHMDQNNYDNTTLNNWHRTTQKVLE